MIKVIHLLQVAPFMGRPYLLFLQHLPTWILTYFGSSLYVRCGCHGNATQHAASCFIFSPSLHFSPVCACSRAFLPPRHSTQTFF